MEQVLFRIDGQEKKELKARSALLGLSIQDYLTVLVNLDKEKNLVKLTLQPVK